MPFGDSKSYIENLIVRELTKAGEGQFDAAMAKRLATAVAEAIVQNNGTIEADLRQKMQVSGLHV